MKDLNLSSGFQYWDWNKDDDTIKAYYAVLTKNYTREFKASVWNNLCFKLKSALSAMNLEWDTKYSNFADVILEGSYPVLTARMFNSVRHNIEVHVPTTWKWAYDRAFDGYVGKIDFIGAIDSRNPDTLYGSYILEIARKLNILISIFKNYASFVEPTVNFTAYIDNSKVILSSLDSLMLNIDTTLETEYDSTISFIEPFELNIDWNEYANSEGAMKLKKALETMRSSTALKFSCDATMILEELYRNLYSIVIGKSSEKAKLRSTDQKILFGIREQFNQSSNALMSYPDLAKLIVNVIYNQTEEVALTNIEPLKFYIDALYEMGESSQLEYVQPRLIQASSSGAISSEGEMYLYLGSEFFSVVMSTMKLQRTIMNRGVSVRFRSSIVSNHSITSSMISRLAQVLGTSTVYSEFVIEGYTHVFERILMGGSAESEIIDDALINAFLSTQMDSFVSSTLETSSSMESKLIRQAVSLVNLSCSYAARMVKKEPLAIVNSYSYSMNVPKAMLEPYKEDSVLLGVLDTHMGGIYTLETLYYPEDVFLVNGLYETTNDSNITYISPTLFDINHIEEEMFDAEVSLKDAEDTLSISTTAFEHTFDANLKRVKFISFDSHIQFECNIEAQINFDPSSWYNPEVDDGKLTIYQAYDINANNEQLHLYEEDDV